MSVLKESQQPRFDASEIIISDVTKEDLLGVAHGYYTCFAEDWHSRYEPVAGRPTEEVRRARIAKRIEPWLKLPHTYWRKATLASDPTVVIGHAGWLAPGRTPHLNLWRRDAAQTLGFLELMDWTEAEEAEMWQAFQVDVWQENFIKYDSIRKEIMGDEPHWFLAPLWVLPEYQKRGVSSLLLKDVMKLADAQNPPVPMYLEASPAGRPIYEHFGWESVPGEDRDHILVRRGPKNVLPATEPNVS